MSFSCFQSKVFIPYSTRWLELHVTFMHVTFLLNDFWHIETGKITAKTEQITQMFLSLTWRTFLVCPLDPNTFIFMQFSAKNLPNDMLVHNPLGLAPPLPRGGAGQRNPGHATIFNPDNSVQKLGDKPNWTILVRGFITHVAIDLEYNPICLVLLFFCDKCNNSPELK